MIYDKNYYNNNYAFLSILNFFTLRIFLTYALKVGNVIQLFFSLIAYKFISYRIKLMSSVLKINKITKKYNLTFVN